MLVPSRKPTFFQFIAAGFTYTLMIAAGSVALHYLLSIFHVEWP